MCSRLLFLRAAACHGSRMNKLKYLSKKFIVIGTMTFLSCKAHLGRVQF